MVTIKFYQDPTLAEFTESTHIKVVHYLSDRSLFKDQLLDLRFFRDEILGVEIDQSDLSFLEISEGTIAITLDSMIPRGPETWVYLAISVAFAAISYLIAPSIPNAQESGARKGQSSTNKLGSSSNDPRINERIDDIFGYVSKHTPPLWQVPYRIGVDNQETEVLLLCVGRGKYLLEEEKIYDGDTRLIDIPNAQFSKYEPGAYPGSGTPSLKIGDDIDEPIGIYRQSNDLNPSELLPPNDLPTANIGWVISGSGVGGTSATLYASSMPDEFDFEDYYNVDDVVNLNGLNYFNYIELITLYRSSGPLGLSSYDIIDLGEGDTLGYLITAVTSDTLTVTIPGGASAAVVNAWEEMTSYVVPYLSYHVFNNSSTDFYALLIADDLFEDAGLTIPVSHTRSDYVLLVGAESPGVLGPIAVPDNADEIILNFVSKSGFYKLSNNNELSITAQIEIVIAEVDGDGDPTGEETPLIIDYDSNESIRRSTFKTERITLPYTNRTVSARRLTARDKSTGISNVDIIEWRDLYSFESVSSLDFGDVTLAHVVIPSNSQSQLIKARRQNMDVTRLITQYLGDDTFGTAESYATDNFAQILIHTALDPYIGRLTIDDINADGFLSLSSQIVTYFSSSEMVRFGYDFDNTSVTYQDTFIAICDAVNCLAYVQFGVYDAFFEKLQATSSMQITCRNKIIDSETREINFERQYDGVELSYRDELSSISEIIYLPTDQSAKNPERKELLGCITELQAFRYAARMLNKQMYSRMVVSFDVDEFGRNIIPGKRIDSPDGTRFTLRDGVTDGYKVYQGEVVEITGLNVELSDPVEFTGGEDHYIVFTKDNGDNSESVLCTSVDDFTVLLSALPSESIYDGYSKDRTKYTFSSEQLRDSIALLPKTIEFKINDEGSEVNTIGSINYSDNYYKDDQDTP